jgi:hypothetical protein
MSLHVEFLSSPKFISDLLYISDVLKTINVEKRNSYLKEILEEINKSLPPNVYVPIS